MFRIVATAVIDQNSTFMLRKSFRDSYDSGRLRPLPRRNGVFNHSTSRVSSTGTSSVQQQQQVAAAKADTRWLANDRVRQSAPLRISYNANDGGLHLRATPHSDCRMHEVNNGKSSTPGNRNWVTVKIPSALFADCDVELLLNGVTKIYACDT